MKMKTNRSAAKRFKKTKGGVKRGRANRRHLLTSKTTKRKRHLRRRGKLVDATRMRDMERMLPY